MESRLSVLMNKVKFIDKINNYLKKQYIWLIPLFICLFITQDFKFYILANNILSIAVILVFICINIMRRKNMDNDLRKKIQITQIVSIILIVLNVVMINVLFLKSYIEDLFILFSIEASLEYCQVQSIFNFDKNMRQKKLVFLYHFLALILLVYIFNLQKLNNNNRVSFFVFFTSLNVLVSYAVGFSTLESVIRKTSTFTKPEIRKIFFYMISIVVKYIGLIGLLKGVQIVTLSSIIIKCIAFYKFYDFIISNFLYDSFKKINKNIELVTNAKKQVNSILIKRNTILKETNIMIQKSQDKYNKLIDSIYGEVFLFSSNKLKYASKRTLRVLKVDNYEIMGMDLEKFIYKFFYTNLDNIKKSHNHISSIKMKNTNSDVEIFLVEVDSKTKLLYVQDITEINENKNMIKEFEEYLKEDELKKEFFANISHELKTPINLIFSALQVNQMYLKDGNVEGVKKNRKIIRQNCLRLVRTINNFIDANRVSEGYMTPDYKIYNIVDIIENIALACNKYIKLIDNTLIFDSEEEEVFVNCDKEMIRRIILNILSNSVKYGKKNGNIEVNIFVHEEEKVIVKIKNDGLKIHEKTIPYIFEKFTKLNKAFNRIKEGSGLGMFLTKALVELQGGSISLFTSDNGNEFVITFPITKNPQNVDMHKELEINPLEEKVDVEFSDIYIE